MLSAVSRQILFDASLIWADEFKGGLKLKKTTHLYRLRIRGGIKNA